MKRVLCVALALLVAAGCSDPPVVDDSAARLMRANQELERLVQSQARTSQTLVLVVGMLGDGPAASLMVVWRKRRSAAGASVAAKKTLIWADGFVTKEAPLLE